MNKKLCVAGCSFSDYTEIDTVYGEILAEKLGYDYLHEAKGGGSNYRIWRRITNHVMNGTLTPNDLLIIQYTGYERDEFWSSLFPYPYVGDFKDYEIYDTGILTQFKVHSHTWQHHPIASEFHLLKENHFSSYEFDTERFNCQHLMFQTMLLYKKIPTIFTRGIRISQLYEVLPEHEKMFFDDEKTNIFDVKYHLTPDDYAHMNQEGHYVYADLLYDHITSLDIL